MSTNKLIILPGDLPGYTPLDPSAERRKHTETEPHGLEDTLLLIRSVAKIEAQERRIERVLRLQHRSESEDGEHHGGK